MLELFVKKRYGPTASFTPHRWNSFAVALSSWRKPPLVRQQQRHVWNARTSARAIAAAAAAPAGEAQQQQQQRRKAARTGPAPAEVRACLSSVVTLVPLGARAWVDGRHGATATSAHASTRALPRRRLLIRRWRLTGTTACAGCRRSAPR